MMSQGMKLRSYPGGNVRRDQKDRKEYGEKESHCAFLRRQMKGTDEEDC